MLGHQVALKNSLPVVAVLTYAKAVGLLLSVDAVVYRCRNAASVAH